MWIKLVLYSGIGNGNGNGVNARTQVYLDDVAVGDGVVDYAQVAPDASPVAGGGKDPLPSSPANDGGSDSG